MQTAWPVTLLFGLVLVSAAVLFALLVEHLRPHPEDVRYLGDKLTSMNLQVQSVSRIRSVFPLHYRKPARHLSRFARFYNVEAKTPDGELKRLRAAFDPWHSQSGVQIL